MNDKNKVDVIKKWLGTGSINVFGLPLSGKDTQCKKLADLLGAQFISSGEVLRRDWDGYDTNEGRLTPFDDFNQIVLPYLSQPKFAHKPLILSSIGRWQGEEAGVINTLLKSNHVLKAVVYLDISENDTLDRLGHRVAESQNARPDDTVEAMQVRLAEYRQKTIPVIEYYRSAGLLLAVDGKPSREEIFENIIELLYQRSIQDQA